MNKLFYDDGRIFMEVTPVKALFHSGLIHDVITKGGKFVVDLNTNELTIYRPKVEKPKKKVNPRYKPLHEPTITISDDLDVALVQLADQYYLGKHLGNFYYGDSKNRRRVFSNGDWEAFKETVIRFYRE